MLRLIRVVIVLTLVWCAYWYAAGYGLCSGVVGWFESQRLRGWQADYATISTSGFPLSHKTLLINPALADPSNGTAWQADWLELDSPAIWPGRQTLRFSEAPQRLSYLDRHLTLQAEEMEALLHLEPGVALTLNQMSLTANRWTMSDGSGPVLGAQDLTLAMVQTDQPDTYTYDIEAGHFTLGDDLRRLLGSSTTLPQSFETLKLNTTIQFDKPWDRSALEERRPQPTQVDLALAEMHWGALRLFATGQLSIDELGVPTGEIALKAENWREMLTMAHNAGAIPTQAVNPAERVLSMLAGLGGNPQALDVQLNFRDGYVALGPIPLGPAPRLILR